MDIRRVGAELLHADGQKNKKTNMTRLLVLFAILQMRLRTEKCFCQSNRRAVRSECSGVLVAVTEITNKLLLRSLLT